MLATPDLEATRTFYTEVLGFTCDNSTQVCVHLLREDVVLMFSIPNEHRPFQAPP